jgi:hypothetical protein
LYEGINLYRLNDSPGTPTLSWRLYDDSDVNHGKYSSSDCVPFTDERYNVHAHRIAYTFGNGNRDALAHASTEAFSYAYCDNANRDPHLALGKSTGWPADS